MKVAAMTQLAGNAIHHVVPCWPPHQTANRVAAKTSKHPLTYVYAAKCRGNDAIVVRADLHDASESSDMYTTNF